jgi:hypothetical protein
VRNHGTETYRAVTDCGHDCGRPKLAQWFLTRVFAIQILGQFLLARRASENPRRRWKHEDRPNQNDAGYCADGSSAPLELGCGNPSFTSGAGWRTTRSRREVARPSNWVLVCIAAGIGHTLAGRVNSAICTAVWAIPLNVSRLLTMNRS